MRLLFRIAAFAVVLVGGAWAVLFCLANNAVTQLDLVIVRLPEAPVSIWVLGAFVAGGLSGLLAASLALWRARAAVLALRRAAAQATADAPVAR